MCMKRTTVYNQASMKCLLFNKTNPYYDNYTQDYLIC